MKLQLPRILAALALCLAAGTAQALVTCSITSSGFATAYSGSASSTQSSFTVTCNRNLAKDPVTVNYSVGIDNGLNPAGGSNRARLAAGNSYVGYDMFQDACLTPWAGVPQSIRIPFTMALSGFTPTSLTLPYWGCLPAAQIVPAGLYTDTVTLTVYNALKGNTKVAINTAPVSITAPASCSISTAPADIALNYTAFGAAVTASTTFGVTCTSLLAYNMALDTGSAVLTGINYSLALSSGSGAGTGFEQAYTVTVSAPAGQAGSCAAASCTAAQPHTLLISY